MDFATLFCTVQGEMCSCKSSDKSDINLDEIKHFFLEIGLKVSKNNMK